MWSQRMKSGVLLSGLAMACGGREAIRDTATSTKPPSPAENPVVVERGANDGLRGLPVSATRATLGNVLSRIRRDRPDATILLVQMEAPPNLGPKYTSVFRAMFPELAKEHGATLLPFLLEGVAGVSRLNQSDGIHPNNAGERIVAENVWRVLRPVLKS